MKYSVYFGRNFVGKIEPDEPVFVGDKIAGTDWEIKSINQGKRTVKVIVSARQQEEARILAKCNH